MRILEHQNTIHMICPYCGYEDLNSWEFTHIDDTVTCKSCEREFDYEREINVTYNTFRKTQSHK